MPTQRLSDPDDPRLAPYRLIRDPELVRTSELFLAEGRLVLEVLLRTPGWELHSVVVTPTAQAALAEALAQVEDTVPVYVVEPACLRAVGGVRFHQGCLAAGVRPPRATVGTFLGALPQPASKRLRLLVLDGVGNPDNVGTIIRSARAFGVDGVLLSASAASPLYRKALRTSLGAALLVPFVHTDLEGPALLRSLRAGGHRIAALTPAREARSLADWVRDPVLASGVGLALVLGSEGAGLAPESLEAADDLVRIAMREDHDSINVAAAAAIALYSLDSAT